LRLLAFDTSGAAISAAAAEAGLVRIARHEPLARGHAERLLPLLREVLTEAGWTWGDLQLIAVTVGPGNFTGLRAGIAVARSLAMALDCGTVGVGTLEIVADAAAAQVPENGQPIQVVLDARRGEVYAQCFSTELLPLGPPELIGRQELAQGVSRHCLLAGDIQPIASNPLIGADLTVEAGPDARYLVHAVQRRFAAGLPPQPGTTLRPIYPRPPDARVSAGASLVTTER
jgi:tRNA threonylcarbamoyladenosine biosynthesis protein TsaB